MNTDKIFSNKFSEAKKKKNLNLIYLIVDFQILQKEVNGIGTLNQVNQTITVIAV